MNIEHLALGYLVGTTLAAWWVLGTILAKLREIRIHLPPQPTIYENGTLITQDPEGHLIEIRPGGQWVYLGGDRME